MISARAERELKITNRELQVNIELLGNLVTQMIRHNQEWSAEKVKDKKAEAHNLKKLINQLDVRAGRLAQGELFAG